MQLLLRAASGWEAWNRLFATLPSFSLKSCFWPFWKGGNLEKNILPYPVGATVVKILSLQRGGSEWPSFTRLTLQRIPNESVWLGWSLPVSPLLTASEGIQILGVWLQNRKPTCAGSDGPWPVSYNDHMWPMGNTHFSLITGRYAL